MLPIVSFTSAIIFLFLLPPFTLPAARGSTPLSYSIFAARQHPPCRARRASTHIDSIFAAWLCQRATFNRTAAIAVSAVLHAIFVLFAGCRCRCNMFELDWGMLNALDPLAVVAEDGAEGGAQGQLVDLAAGLDEGAIDAASQASLAVVARARGRGVRGARRGRGRGRGRGRVAEPDAGEDGQAAEPAAGHDGLAGRKRTWAQRSWGLMRFAREVRTKKKVARGLARLRPLVHAWNEQRLRRGDEVVLPGESPQPMVHPNSYRPSAVLREAWRGIRRPAQREGFDGTHMGLDILCGVAGVMHHAQRLASSSFLGEVDEPLIVMRHYDFTPMKVRFGSLQAQLMPHARYWRHDGDCWRAVEFAEISKRYGSSLHFGTVEVFAECTTVHHVNGEHGVVTRRYFVPPCVGQRANACCTFEALEQSLPELNVASINGLARRLGWLFYMDSPDAAGANMLKQKYLSSLLDERVATLRNLVYRVSWPNLILHIIILVMVP